MISVFAKNMVKIRKLHELTQQEAADLIGINRHNLGSYEEGRAEPSYHILLKICKGYQVENIDALIWKEAFLEDDDKPDDIHPIVRAYNKATMKEKNIVKMILNLK